MISSRSLVSLLFALVFVLGISIVSGESEGWTQSYAAGFRDKNGAHAGGSEIMHLVAHKGALYAANGYWLDARWVIPPEEEKQSAQVLRLDAPGEYWVVDLELGKTNGLGLNYMKGNILKSVTFTQDEHGRPLAKPVNLLVMSAGANFDGGGAVSAWVREDETGQWHHQLVRHGSSSGGVRWVPRDLEVYRDKVTGRERLYLSLGNPGIASGVYDPDHPGKIRWSPHLEYPFLTQGHLRTRPLGLVQANGSLIFSEGGALYRRVDGERPSYEEILNLNEDTDTDVGGIRGLTVIENPKGAGDSLLFLWAPGGGSTSQIKRLDPDGQGGYTVHNEVQIMEIMEERLGVDVTYTLGAHNMMYPVTDPDTGVTLRIIGFQGNIRGRDELRWPGSPLYGGAQYALRRTDVSVRVLEVNNDFRPGRLPLVAPRAFCVSPFGDEALYIGGHDSSNKVSDNMAWIFRAPLDVALGTRRGSDAPARPEPPKPDKRLLEGPVYELRIYRANEQRFDHLLKRFRDHTDGFFRKRNMKAVGYWIPTDGTAKQKRTLYYILEHPSRHAAYRNWVDFNNAGEWKRVLDRPEFQGLLAGRPDHHFLTNVHWFDDRKNLGKDPGGHYELRTFTASEADLSLVRRRLNSDGVSILRKHGIELLAVWNFFDRPESESHLLCLLKHDSRDQADARWTTCLGDPDWQDLGLEIRSNRDTLGRPSSNVFLQPTDFSQLR